jgi:hypothetical protein
VTRDQRLELRDDVVVAAERQVGLDALLQHRQLQLLEPRDLDAAERLGGELGQRRAAPAVERLAEQGRRPPGVAAGEGRAAVAEQPLDRV